MGRALLVGLCLSAVACQGNSRAATAGLATPAAVEEMLQAVGAIPGFHRLLFCGYFDKAGLGCSHHLTAPAHTLGMVSPEEKVVLDQVEAYNRHDVDAFLATYSRNAELLRFPDLSLASGYRSLRTSYEALFRQIPGISVTVSRRLVSDKYVILVERLSFFPGSDTTMHLVIYEVGDNRIVRVWFLTE